MTNPSSFIPSHPPPTHHPLYTAPNMKTFLILLEGVSQYFVSIISLTCNLKVNSSFPESSFVSRIQVLLYFKPFLSTQNKLWGTYTFSESGQKLVRFSSTRQLTSLKFSEPSWLTIVVAHWVAWLWLLFQKMCLPTLLHQIFTLLFLAFF